MNRAWTENVVRLAAIAVLAGTLAGCSINSDSFGLALADPLRFELYDCKQLAAALATATARAQELSELMRKAGQDASGVVVARLAYGNDYARARGEMKVLQDLRQSRECDKQSSKGSNTETKKDPGAS